jgi:hypothetical protein
LLTPSQIEIGNSPALLRYYTLTLSRDGHTLYAVDPTTGITLLDSGSWKIRAVISSAIQSPWGIEWTT